MMNIRLFCLTVGLTLLVGQSVNGDLLREPEEWMKVTESRTALLRMVPAKVRRNWLGRYVVDEPALAMGYRIQANGELAELWQLEGWYSWQGYISDNGRYFVGIEPFPEDSTHFSGVAISFYSNGTLVKKYRVNELLRDPKKVDYTSSSYLWMAAAQTRPNGVYGSSFHLVMCDKTKYTFDLATGRILATGTDPKSMSLEELLDRRTGVVRKKSRARPISGRE